MPYVICLSPIPFGTSRRSLGLGPWSWCLQRVNIPTTNPCPKLWQKDLDQSFSQCFHCNPDNRRW